MFVGTVVEVAKAMTALKLKVGEVGLCYEEASHEGKPLACMLFASGHIYTFDREMYDMALEQVGFSDSLADYSFTSMQKLEYDYVTGQFDSVFKRKTYERFELSMN